MDLSEKLFWLRHSRVLQLLSDDELRELAVLAPDHRYSRGDYVFSAGDEARSLYVLKQGSVLLSRVSPDGREKSVGTAQPGDLFGELLLAPSGERHRSQALVQEDALVCRLAMPTVVSLMLRKPAVAVEMVRVLARRLLESEDEIERLSFDSAETRVLDTLTRLAAQAGSALRPITLRVTHEELARMVGASRETVTGVMGRLRRQGLVEIHYGTLTVNLDQLRDRRIQRQPRCCVQSA